MGAFIAGLLGGIGQSMQKQRQQKTLMDFQREQTMSDWLMQMAQNPDLTPDQAAKYHQEAFAIKSGQQKFDPKRIVNLHADTLTESTQRAAEQKKQADDAARAEAIAALHSQSAQFAAQPIPAVPSIGGLVTGQERVAPMPTAPPTAGAAPVGGGGTGTAPVEANPAFPGMALSDNPTVGELRTKREVDRAIRIASEQTRLNEEANERKIQRNVNMLKESGDWEKLTAEQRANVRLGHNVPFERATPVTHLSPPVKIKLTKGRGEVMASYDSVHNVYTDGKRIWMLEDVEEKSGSEKTPNQYEDFKTDYLKNHPKAGSAEILREFKKVTQNPPTPQSALMLIPNPGGGYTATTVQAGQMVAPGAVTPQGASSMNVPTAATRGMAEKAPRVNHFVKRINQLLDENEKQLGPLASRWNEFTAGKIGVPNRGYMQLRTDLGLLHTALMNMHVGSRGGERIMQHFADMIQGAKQSPENLRAALGEIETYTKEVEKEGLNRGIREPEGQTARTAQGGYKIGSTYQGMKYLGGNPTDESSWSK